jgi:hypothetical protein
MPAPNRRAPGSLGLVALVLATLAMPATAAQPAATPCTAMPVLGRTGDVLYWTFRPGCVVALADLASGDGQAGRNVRSARRSDADTAEVPRPVSGIAVDTPIMR